MPTPVQSSVARESQSRDCKSSGQKEHYGARSIPRIGLLAPWYWPTWLFFGVAWLVARLPFKIQIRLGQQFAHLLFAIFPRRKKIIRKNIDLAFSDWSDAEKENLSHSTIQSVGSNIAETMFVWMRGVDPLIDRVKITGLEHLARDDAGNSFGIVILGAHFSSLDLVAPALARKCSFGATYRRAKNPVVDFVSRRARSRYYNHMLDATNLRAIANSLSNGNILWYATDQDMGNRKTTCFVPFFGIDVSTVLTPFRMARKTGSRVVFMSHKRDLERLTWEVSISPVTLSDPSDSKCFEHDAAHVNQLIENEVRLAPEQYFWVHRRFKSMANGGRRSYKD